MALARFFCILLSVMAPAFAWSAGQLRCDSVWTDPSASRPSLDPAYLESVRAWEREAVPSRFQVWRGQGLTDESVNFDMDRFLNSREFRTWFEYQNRVLKQLDKKAPPAPARIKFLPEPQAALAAQLLAIRGARYTIDIAYYIFRNDSSGLSIIHELKNAISRGVDVRFIIDSAGSLDFSLHGHLRALIDHASKNAGLVRNVDGTPTPRRASAEVVIFNSLLKAPSAIFANLHRRLLSVLNPWLGKPPVAPVSYSWNRRSHDKILLIDGAFQENSIAFLGGRNIGDQYFGLPEIDSRTYKDFQVMIRGVSVEGEGVRGVGTQITDYFEQVYFHLGNSSMSRSLLGFLLGYGRQHLKAEETHRLTLEKLELTEDPDSLREELLNSGFEDSQADIVNTIHNVHRRMAHRAYEHRDYRTEVRNSQGLLSRVEELIKNEDQEVVIISPFLWLSQKQVRLLKAWLLKDPRRRLTLITNSMANTDNMGVQILGDHIIGPLLAKDPGIVREDGTVKRRSIADQVRFYQYGRLSDLDGNVPPEFGILHAKGLYLKGSQTSVVGTSNNDPRSLLLNSEGAVVIKNAELAKQFEDELNQVIARSHLWGSPEYFAVRQHPRIGAARRTAAQFSHQINAWLLKLNLWWYL